GGVGGFDLQAPGKVRGQAEELVVEPVAEATHRLREKQSGGEGVGEGPEADAGPPAAQPGTDRAAEERAEDRDAALPDRPDRTGLEGVPGVAARAEVEAGVGEHVEDARAD